MKRLILLIVLIPFIQLTVANAAITKTSELKKITNRITLLKNSILHFRYQKSYLSTKLKKAEIDIGDISKRLHSTSKQLYHETHLLRANEKALTNYQHQLTKQQNLLAKQMRAMYAIGRQPYLKILLNQQNPEKISRYLQYYGALNEARIKIIQSIKKITAHLKQTADKIKQQTEKLRSIHQQQNHQHNNLKKKQKQRQYLLKQTSKQLNTKSQQLQQLIQDKQHLTDLINLINKEKAYGYSPGKSIQEMRKKLLWPIQGGKIIQSFGVPIAGGRLHSTGILIQAKDGAPIYAIFPGKVVFANWLHGFGLMTIIQHGENYMTLYARNQALYVKLGETVHPGQRIATVGNSGGFQHNALYFEIRHRGKPMNPLLWLHRR